MKIKQTTSSDKFSEDNDYRNFLHIEINGEKKFHFLDGEPEDNNLSRDFSDCYDIVSALKLAFEAGKNGETLEVEQVKSDDFI